MRKAERKMVEWFMDYLRWNNTYPSSKEIVDKGIELGLIRLVLRANGEPLVPYLAGSPIDELEAYAATLCPVMTVYHTTN